MNPFVFYDYCMEYSDSDDDVHKLVAIRIAPESILYIYTFTYCLLNCIYFKLITINIFFIEFLSPILHVQCFIDIILSLKSLDMMCVNNNTVHMFCKCWAFVHYCNCACA